MSKEILLASVGSINADLVAYTHANSQRAGYAYGSKFELNLGGKSLNVALTASALVDEVVLIARVGDDVFGIDILDRLMRRGVRTQHIKIDHSTHTGIGHVRVDQNGQYDTIVINGANWNLTEEDIDDFISEGYLPKYAVFNFETDIALLAKIIPKFKTLGSEIVINFSPIVNDMRELMSYTDIAVLNLAEAQQVLISQETSVEVLLKGLQSLGPETVVITLGVDGAAAMNSTGEVFLVPGQSANVINTVGAGDGFLASLICSLASGLDLEQSLINATYVGKVICTKQAASLEKEDVHILNSEATYVRVLGVEMSVREK